MSVKIEVGTGLVCDTQEQIEQYIDNYDGDATAAIKAVNARHGDTAACGVMTIAFVRGATVESMSHGDMAFTVVRILVVGVDNATGFRPVKPEASFTIFGTKELSV